MFSNNFSQSVVCLNCLKSVFQNSKILILRRFNLSSFVFYMCFLCPIQMALIILKYTNFLVFSLVLIKHLGLCLYQFITIQIQFYPLLLLCGNGSGPIKYLPLSYWHWGLVSRGYQKSIAGGKGQCFLVPMLMSQAATTFTASPGLAYSVNSGQRTQLPTMFSGRSLGNCVGECVQ